MIKKFFYYHRKKNYSISISKDPIEGGYTVAIPDLPGCVTCCEKWEDIPAMIEDAKKCWLECFLSSTFPEKKRQNSLFLARDYPCFRQDVLCILTHEGMFHPVAFSLKDQ